MSKVNKFTGRVALLSLIGAGLVAGSGIWFAWVQGEECAELARWPVDCLGGVIVLVALAGFVGAYLNKRPLLCIYFPVMGLLIASLVVFIVIGSVITGGSGAYPVLGRAYEEYRLDGFSMWLRRYVSDNPARWEGIMSCLADSGTCKTLARQASFVTADQFYHSDLTPLQSGCCKPPSECGFGYVGPTVWTNPTSAPVPDCGLWSNNPGQLCYECESCRAGLLATLRSQWRKTSIFLIVATVLLGILNAVGYLYYRKASWW